jgi:hypothetical protein
VQVCRIQLKGTFVICIVGNESGGRVVTQQCLACTRPQVQSPAPQKERESGERERRERECGGKEEGGGEEEERRERGRKRRERKKRSLSSLITPQCSCAVDVAMLDAGKRRAWVGSKSSLSPLTSTVILSKLREL